MGVKLEIDATLDNQVQQPPLFTVPTEYITDDLGNRITDNLGNWLIREKA